MTEGRVGGDAVGDALVFASIEHHTDQKEEDHCYNAELGIMLDRGFHQEEGEGKVYVSEKTDTFFVVSGTENLAFSWTAVIEEKEEMNGRTGI